MRILLCSESSIKKETLEKFLREKFPNDTLIIDTVGCDDLGLPPQPVNCASFCAKARLDFAKTRSDREYDYYISIENGLVTGTKPYDECSVVVEHRNIMVTGGSVIFIPDQHISLLDKLGEMVKHNDQINGYVITFGELLHEKDSCINPKDWMKTTSRYGRKTMISSALEVSFKDLDIMIGKINTVLKSYKEYPDFPKPGVVFQDIFAVLANPKSLRLLTDIIQSRYILDHIDYVVGLESRGFFGVLLAEKLGVGFIPIRKAGKLPGPTEQIEYGTEYSKDKCEIQKDIPKGSRVIIFDDLIATGGSMKASIDLLEKMECVIVDCCVLREVKPLREAAREKLGCRCTVLLLD